MKRSPSTTSALTPPLLQSVLSLIPAFVYSHTLLSLQPHASDASPTSKLDPNDSSHIKLNSASRASSTLRQLERVEGARARCTEGRMQGFGTEGGIAYGRYLNIAYNLYWPSLTSAPYRPSFQINDQEERRSAASYRTTSAHVKRAEGWIEILTVMFFSSSSTVHVPSNQICCRQSHLACAARCVDDHGGMAEGRREYHSGFVRLTLGDAFFLSAEPSTHPPPITLQRRHNDDGSRWNGNGT
ncbi:hypothetical protein C8F01DRAFT_1231794, partial [Mycena amicta]